MSERDKTKGLSFITDRHAGTLSAIRNDQGWLFDLEINALRVEDLTPWREAVAASLLHDISAFIVKQVKLPETAPTQGSELFLGYDIKGGECTSTSHEVEK